MTIFKRDKSTFWQYEFHLDSERYRGSTKTANKREATEFEARVYAEAKEDKEKSRLGMKRMTLDDLAISWLKASEISHADHRNNVSRMRKLFGDEMQQQGTQWVLVTQARFGLPRKLGIHEVTQSLLVELRDARQTEGCAPATINREISLIQAMLGYAASISCVMPERPIVWSQKRNKAASLKMREPKGKLRWFTMAEEDLLLATLAERADESPNDQCLLDNLHLVTLLLDTGARYAEIASHTWDMVNLEAGTISLYRSKVDNESNLKLTQRALKVLKTRKALMEGQRYSYVFPAMKGRAWGGLNKPRGHATQAIQRIIDGLGFNDQAASRMRATPHTFRDTYASRLVQAGVTLIKVANLLGHADESMTKKYAHLCPEATGQESADVLDRLAANKVAQGDDPIDRAAKTAGFYKVAQGDDPIGPHTYPHTEATHTQRFALKIVEKKPQVIDSQGVFRESLVGRAGVEPATNGLKVRCSTN